LTVSVTHGPHARGPIHPEIGEAVVDVLVERFYERVRADALLGPIFDRAIGADWDRHLAKLKDFWTSITMMSGRYKGNPFAAHQRIGAIGGVHFERWLSLWRETAHAVCPSRDVAEIFIERADRIAASLKAGLAGVPRSPEPRDVPAADAAQPRGAAD